MNNGSGIHIGIGGLDEPNRYAAQGVTHEGRIGINETDRSPRRGSSILHQVLDGRLLAQRQFLSIGKGIGIRIIAHALVQVPEMIKFVPIHEPVPIAVLIARHVMGHHVYIGGFDLHLSLG